MFFSIMGPGKSKKITQTIDFKQPKIKNNTNKISSAG